MTTLAATAVGFKNPITELTCVPDRSAGASMIAGRVLAVCLYRAAMYLQLLLVVLRRDRSKEIEILVLRHQVTVLNIKSLDRILRLPIESCSPPCPGCCTTSREGCSW